MADTARITDKYKGTPGYGLLKDPSRVLFVSSAHVGAITEKKLESAASDGSLEDARVTRHAHGEYLIELGQGRSKLAAVSRCFYDMILLAVSGNKSVICIDPDADPIPGLTLYRH